MTTSSVQVSTGDYLFGIAQRDTDMLRQIMAADTTITSEMEAAGRYAMIIAAANDLRDMDEIYAGTELTIPAPDVVLRTSVLASTKDTRDAATLVQVYREVEPDYRNGGKERIQVALNAGEPAQVQAVDDSPAEVEPSTLDPERAQQLVNAAGSYYIAIAAYDEILETLPPADRADAARLLQNTQGLRASVEQRFPNRTDLIEAAARAEVAATSVEAIMATAAGDGSLGAPTTPDDTNRLLNITRVKAMQDQVPGDNPGEVTVEKARSAVTLGLSFSPSGLDANAIMAAAPDTVMLETSLAASAATTTAPAIENGFIFRMDMEGRTNFSFTDLAELPLNDANYNAGRDNVNATGGMGARQELARLRSDVREALIENGVANPSEKQVTQATAYLLAVENGNDNRKDTIRDDRNVSVPPSEAVARGVAIFAPAMMQAEGTSLSGGEQRENLDDVERALFTPNVNAGAEVQQR